MNKNGSANNGDAGSVQEHELEEDEVVEILPRLSQLRLDIWPGEDRYWKLMHHNDHYTVPITLVKQTLLSDGYVFPKGATFRDLVPLAQRSQIGLMSYDQLDAEELKGFMKARKRKIPKGCGRLGYIKLLSEADTKRRFNEYFHKLPVEIQDQIAVHYIKSFPKGLISPMPPPPARTSKAMMKQVMPRFYEHASFLIQLKHRKKLSAFSSRTEHLLARITPKDLSRIRELEIGNDVASDFSQAFVKKFVNTLNVQITIFPKDREFDLEFTEPLDESATRVQKEKREALEEDLEEVLKGVLDRKPPANTFNLHDILALKRVMSKHWRKRY